MNYQFYFYLSCAFGLILTAINIYSYFKKKKIADELNMLKWYNEDLVGKINSKNALLGTRGYQIKKRDEKIALLQEEVKHYKGKMFYRDDIIDNERAKHKVEVDKLKEELFAFHQVTKKKVK
jgi:hypothetical protein